MWNVFMTIGKFKLMLLLLTLGVMIKNNNFRDYYNDYNISITDGQ